MPSVIISKAVDARDAATALKEQLGSDYKVTTHTDSSPQKLRVSHGGLAYATVKLQPDGGSTTFHVHGGGLIIGRLINEFGIARTVTTAIKDSLGSTEDA
jgi:hypothetical protein